MSLDFQPGDGLLPLYCGHVSKPPENEGTCCKKCFRLRFRTFVLVIMIQQYVDPQRLRKIREYEHKKRIERRT